MLLFLNHALQEIQHAYHTNALLVKILLSQAQANGLNLEVDTAKLENEFLLKQIATSEEVALSRPASDFVRRGGALGKLGGVSTIAVQDAGMVCLG
jgi:leucine zipper transcription factor-like protein 1